MDNEASNNGEYSEEDDGESSGDESPDGIDDVTPHSLDEDDGSIVGGGWLGEGDYSVNEFSVQQRVMHFLRQKIDRGNSLNVEICLLLEAGTSVSDESTTVANLRNDMMMTRYVNLVRNFSSEDFIEPAIQEDMALRLFNAKKTMTGMRLWEKFVAWRKEVRTMYTPKLPREISSIPSGQQLRDIYRKFVLDRFKEENVRITMILLLFLVVIFRIVILTNISYASTHIESRGNGR